MYSSVPGNVLPKCTHPKINWIGWSVENYEKSFSFHLFPLVFTHVLLSPAQCSLNSGRVGKKVWKGHLKKLLIHQRRQLSLSTRVLKLQRLRDCFLKEKLLPTGPFRYYDDTSKGKASDTLHLSGKAESQVINKAIQRDSLLKFMTQFGPADTCNLHPYAFCLHNSMRNRLPSRARKTSITKTKMGL